MSMKRYPIRECHDCTHVVDIEEDITGRDLITCELDDCEYCSCIKNDQSVFKPCPMCGRRLTTCDMYFADEDGGYLEKLNCIRNFSDVLDVKTNAMWPCDRAEAERNGQTGLIKEQEEIYEQAVDNTSAMMLYCGCGFHFYVDADSVDFPGEGWFGRFCEKANRRWKE